MNSDGQLDERKKRCALACIKASQDTMAIAQEMETQGLVCAASWPSVYTIFLATVSLIFFTAAIRGDSPDMFTVKEDADKGMFLLNKLKCYDLGPKRCLAVLEVYTITPGCCVHETHLISWIDIPPSYINQSWPGTTVPNAGRSRAFCASFRSAVDFKHTSDCAIRVEHGCVVSFDW